MGSLAASLVLVARGNPRCRPRVDMPANDMREEQLMRDDEGRKVETAVEARAGFLDRPVLVVLCASLALCVVILGAVWLGLFTHA